MIHFRSHAKKLRNRVGRVMRAVGRLLTRTRAGKAPRYDFPPGQWHRWNKVNQRHRRQLRAWGRHGRKIDPRRADIPRWAVR